jgi:hypothetical protein
MYLINENLAISSALFARELNSVGGTLSGHNNGVVFKKYTMKNYMKMSFASLFIVGSLLVSCSTPAEKVDMAEDESREAKKELRIAKEEYEKEMKEYRKTSEEKIAANEVKIAEFKARISTQKATAKADYEKKVNDLNSKNSDMKMRLDSFKFDSKTKWEAFKFELNKDMDELGQAINDFMGKDEKKK